MYVGETQINHSAKHRHVLGGFVVFIEELLEVFPHHKIIIFFYFSVAEMSNAILILLPTHPGIMNSKVGDNI